MLAEDPFRASSQARDELRAGVRALHLQLAAGRQKGAAHVLYFYVRERNGVAEVVVLRVLAEQMEPKNRIARSLRRED